MALVLITLLSLYTKSWDSMATAIVIGSINVDFTIYLEKFPGIDETVSDGVYEIHFGGKGANQAVGLARLGSRVYMIGKVGMDSLGYMAIENLKRNGVYVDHIARSGEAHTGTAFILVNREGSTMIAVAPGANRHLAPEEVERAIRSIGYADIVLTQLEIPIETVARVSQLCEEVGARLVLTPSPAKKIPRDILRRTHTIIPNRIEIFRIIGKEPKPNPGEKELAEAARELLESGVENIVITLGEKGAAYYDRERGSLTIVPSIKPERVVDTTGAGDSFTACYSYAIASRKSILDAIRMGNICASIKITRKGAQNGMPRLDDVRRALEAIGARTQ